MMKGMKILVIFICLTLVATTVFIVSAQGPKKKYLKLPPIEQPNAPKEGFIVYCDSSDGNLKALDQFGEITILAIPQPPTPPISYNVGLFNHANGVSSQYIAKTYNNCILNVKDGVGNTLFTVDKTESNWNVIEQLGDMSVNYGYSTGIYFTGDSNTKAKYVATTYEGIPIDVLNYTVEMKVYFVSGWGNNGLVYNYVNETIYNYVSIQWERDEYKMIRHHIELEDGEIENRASFPVASGVDYVLLVEVNNYDSICNIYINDVLIMSDSI